MDFPISTQKNQALKKAMDELRIFEKDIQEEFIRSAGAGGQKINKTSSKVVLTYHSYQIKCDKTRKQIMNRYYARKMLIEKISKSLGVVTNEQMKIEKNKKNKLRRKKKAKLKYQ